MTERGGGLGEVFDTSSAAVLVSVGFWLHLQKQKPLPSHAHPIPPPPRLSEGLFSKMGSENSSLFVLAAVPFPAEKAQCVLRTGPGPHGGPHGGGGVLRGCGDEFGG